jgi:hypothetical protein
LSEINDAAEARELFGGLLTKLRAVRGGDASRDSEIVEAILRARTELVDGWPIAPRLRHLRRGTPAFEREASIARAQVEAESLHVHKVFMEAMVELALLASGANPR